MTTGGGTHGSTTMAVMKMMGMVNPDGTTRVTPPTTALELAKVAEAPRIPLTKPLSGGPDYLVDLSLVDQKARDAKLSMMTDEEREALKERVAAAPAKLEAARAAGKPEKAIKEAEMKVAEMQDRLTADTRARAKHYMLSAAYLIGRDFRVKAGNDLASALTVDGGDVTFNVPGLLTFRLNLAGPDDEIPF